MAKKQIDKIFTIRVLDEIVPAVWLLAIIQTCSFVLEAGKYFHG